MILKFNTFVSSLALGSAIINPFAAASDGNRLLAASDPATAIAGQYIVKLKKETKVPRDADPAMYEKNVDGQLVQTKESLLDFCGETGGKPRHAYQDAFYGCSVSGISEETAKHLAADPRVERVEQDSTVTLEDVGSWGLDRVDQRTNTLDDSFTPRGTGAGVTAYIIDSGILHAHDDFENRAFVGINLTGDNNSEDCNGHGTHVASTVGGVEYGVAKDVILVSVKVFSCSGGSGWDTIIAAIDWVKADADGSMAVANMSLGGGFIQSVNDATAELRDSGVPVSVAAGNGDADACGYSPASEPKAITVGSTTINNDQRSSFSSFGSCLDIWAPGSDITAAWWTNTTATNTISGTSMASPHVCGGLAIAMQETGGNADLAEQTILWTATSGTVIDAGPDSPNEFLYVGELSPTSAPTPGPPTAAPTPCTDYNITVIVATDPWPFETTWELVDLCDGNTTVLEGGPYAQSYSMYTHHYCAPLPVDQGSYMFNFYDSYGDGILYGNYTVYYDDELVVYGGGNFGYNISHPIYGTCEPPTEEPSAAPTTPAPTSNSTGCKDSPTEFHLIAEGGGKVSYKCEYLKSKGDENDVYTKPKCKDDPLLASHCPKSCKACPMYKCKDSMATFYKGKKILTCEDNNILGKCDNPAVKKTCRGTCGFCDDIDYDEE